MSVVKSKRSMSSLEFFHNAILLRKDITKLLMRDFGVKTFHRNIHFVADVHDFEKEDAEVVQQIFDKYDLDRIQQIFDKERIYFMDILRSLFKNIVKANSIYPVNMNEYYERRNYQNSAIGDCEDLLQEMQYILTIMPVNAEKYMKYVEMIEKEIALLKGWRKSDNKIVARLKK